MRTPANRRSLAVGLALLVAASIAWWLASGASHRAARPSREEPPGAAPQSTNSAPAAAPAHAAKEEILPGLKAAFESSQKQMPYRPAQYLLLSAESPSRRPEDDDQQRALQRILAIVEAAPDQAAKIRALWREHEDGRRALFAKAYPSVSRPRTLDPARLAVLDSAFEAALFAGTLLDAAQRDRLARELAPSTEPLPIPPTYSTPRWNPDDQQ